MARAPSRRPVLKQPLFREATLVPERGGTWRISGLAGGPAEEVVRSPSAIVLKEPGRSTNMSGIRGMPNRRYVPARTSVWTILETLSDGRLRCKAVIGWGQD